MKMSTHTKKKRFGLNLGISMRAASCKVFIVSDGALVKHCMTSVSKHMVQRRRVSP